MGKLFFVEFLLSFFGLSDKKNYFTRWMNGRTLLMFVQIAKKKKKKRVL